MILLKIMLLKLDAYKSYAFVVLITPVTYQIFCSFPNWFIFALIFTNNMDVYQLNWRRRAQNLSGHLSRPYLVIMCLLFYALYPLYVLICFRSSNSLQVMMWYQIAPSYNYAPFMVLQCCFSHLWNFSILNLFSGDNLKVMLMIINYRYLC